MGGAWRPCRGCLVPLPLLTCAPSISRNAGNPFAFAGSNAFAGQEAQYKAQQDAGSYFATMGARSGASPGPKISPGAGSARHDAGNFFASMQTTAGSGAAVGQST